MSDLDNIDFNTMTVAEFETYLPELFATGGGKLSEDPRFAKFLTDNPDCAALVRDLEAIAEYAQSLFEEPSHEPSDAVWSNIASKLKEGIGSDEEELNGAANLAVE